MSAASLLPAESVLVERKRCPCCDCTTWQVLIREPLDSTAITDFLERQYEGRARLAQLTGATYELVRCTSCRLAYQRYIPGERLLGELYDEWIPDSERERLAAQRDVYDPSYWAQQIHFFIEHFGLHPAEVRVLDFGMGWGEWASMARAFGCDVYGAELSVERLRHAHSIGIPTLDWEQIGARRFHFINTEQVFEHLVEPVQILRHLAGALETGGLLKISVPDARRALRLAARSGRFESLPPALIVPLQPLEHINCFEFDSIARLAAVAGLKPLRPRLRLIYNATSGWLSPKRAARLLLRPIYRHVYPKSTFVYLVRTD